MIESTLSRHLEFWRAANRKPLLAKLPHPGWSRKPYPLSRSREATQPQRIDPEDMDIDRLLGADRIIDRVRTDDYIHGVKPMYPVACMESLIGCPIYAGDTSCYARPHDSVPPNESRPRGEEWVPVLQQILRREVSLARVKLPALQLHLRGIVDMVAAYWGEERMCLAMFDDPQSIHSLVAEFCATYLEVARNGVELRPPWRNGYVSHWGVYAPGPVLDYQVDATSILSKSQYDEFFRDTDERIVASFPYSVVHLHACGLHIAPSIAELGQSSCEQRIGASEDDSLDTSAYRAVEISLDREAGAFDIDATIATVGMIQARDARVILHGELYETELEQLVDTLDPGGLAIFSWRPRPE